MIHAMCEIDSLVIRNVTGRRVANALQVGLVCSGLHGCMVFAAGVAQEVMVVEIGEAGLGAWLEIVRPVGVGTSDKLR